METGNYTEVTAAKGCEPVKRHGIVHFSMVNFKKKRKREKGREGKKVRSADLHPQHSKGEKKVTGAAEMSSALDSGQPLWRYSPVLLSSFPPSHPTSHTHVTHEIPLLI